MFVISEVSGVSPGSNARSVMNSTQRRFIQLGLVLLSFLLVAASWKILPPDSFWLPFSYRIVIDMSGGQQCGLESRFHNMGTSVILGLVAPVVCWGLAMFLQLGRASRT